MAAKVRTTLSQLFKFGSQRGFVTSNPVRDTTLAITDRPEAGEEGEKFILPPKKDFRLLLQASGTFDNTGRAEAIVRTFMFGGLRASELRGLPDVALSLDAAQPKLRVYQRADRFNKIGSVKSKAGRRDIVLGADTVKALKQWLEARPASGHQLHVWIALKVIGLLHCDSVAAFSESGQISSKEGIPFLLLRSLRAQP